MFLFLFAVALVVVASLIFVFTRNWDEDADYPDEALQKEESVFRKKKSEPEIQSPAAEVVLPDKDWIDALITESPEMQKGKHEAEEMSWKQPLEKASPGLLPFEENTNEVSKSTAVFKTASGNKKENYGSLKPFSEDDKNEEPRGEVPPMIRVLEIICGLIAVTAFITIAIAWGVLLTRTGG